VGGMKRKVIRSILIIAAAVCSITAAIGVFMIFSIRATYRESGELYSILAQHHTFGTGLAPERTQQMYLPGEETFTLPDDIVLPTVDFDALGEINPDIVGWLILEDTQINYPVVQGSDNVKYTNHLFNGRRNATGALFVDSYNQPRFADRNTVIYGHNMRNGSMFSVLEQYREQCFFNSHPWIFLLTPEQNYVIELVAGYTSDVQSSAWRLNFADDSEVEDWINEQQKKSDFLSDVQIRHTDCFVTLSTCSWAFDNARYVVVGRLTPIA